MGRIGYFLQRRRPARRHRRRAPRPFPARPRVDVLRPRPAGDLLRRRAGLHRRRWRQGRPRGHVRQLRGVVRGQRSDRHRPDFGRRQLRPAAPAVPDDPGLRPRPQPARRPALGGADPPLQLGRPRRLRLLPHRPGPAHRVRGRPQQQRSRGHGRGADVLPRRRAVPARVAAGVRAGRPGDDPDRVRRRPDRHRAAARPRHLPGQGPGAGQQRRPRRRHHDPRRRRHRADRGHADGRPRRRPSASRCGRSSGPT